MSKLLGWSGLAALLLAALITLTPSLASARAGGSYRFGGSSFSSMGSRGFRTYEGPMERSLTPRPPASGLYGSHPAYGYGYGRYHPFWSGLAGGFFGGWLGSLLFPHWGMGYGYGGGFGSIFGSLFSWLVIIGLIWLGFRALSGRGFSPLAFPDPGLARGAGMGSGYGARGRGAPLAIVQSDYQAFEAILKRVQAAWSSGDLADMRSVTTPEMVSYFADELAGNESQGVRNRIEDVVLERGDLREAWDEGRLQYATCALRWRALDYTVRTDRQPGEPGFIVGGDPRQPTEAAEIWTFVRSPGGHWLLSAIQQF